MRRGSRSRAHWYALESWSIPNAIPGWNADSYPPCGAGTVSKHVLKRGRGRMTTFPEGTDRM